MLAWLYKLLGKPIPYYAKYPLWLILWKPTRKFLNVAIIPYIPYNNVRIILYRLVGYNIGKNVFIGMRCYLDDINPKCITICDDVVISYEVKFAVHGINQAHTPIVLKKGAYIGMGAYLVAGKKGITIGEKAVIGAASLVTSSIPNNGVAVGVPARVIRIEEE